MIGYGYELIAIVIVIFSLIAGLLAIMIVPSGNLT